MAKQLLQEDEKAMLLQCAPAVSLVAVIAIYRFAGSPGAFAWLKMVAAIGMATFCVYQVRCFIRGEPMRSHYGTRLACDEDHKFVRMFYAFSNCAMYLAIVYLLLAGWTGNNL